MSDNQGSAREEPGDPVKGEPVAGMMGSMMSRCDKMMPDVMAMCGGPQDDHKEGVPVLD